MVKELVVRWARLKNHFTLTFSGLVVASIFNWSSSTVHFPSALLPLLTSHAIFPSFDKVMVAPSVVQVPIRLLAFTLLAKFLFLMILPALSMTTFIKTRTIESFVFISWGAICTVRKSFSENDPP